MKSAEEMIEFDDQDAILFITKFIKNKANVQVENDDIQYVLDLICEFYEENNLMEEDNVEAASIEEEDLFEFVLKTIQKEKIIAMDEETLQLLLDGEYEYGKSIGIYFEEN